MKSSKTPKMIIFSWPTIEKSFVKIFSVSSGISNWSRVGAIDKPDRPEQAFNQNDIPKDPEKFHERLFDSGP